MTTEVRLVTLDDLDELTDALIRNREHLAPWEPERGDAHFTAETQRQLIGDSLAAHRAGTMVPLMITVDGELAGRINVLNIVRGFFQSADLGYWVASRHTGHGVATAAVAQVAALAFGELGLHRLQAGTLIHNVGSQTVLLRNGFEQIGVARRYLEIAGRWQDHVLFQRTRDQPIEE